MNERYFLELRQKTEAEWARCEVNPTLYGYQIQRGTCWNPGLTSTEIEQYEAAVRARFPDDFRLMLKIMNGTDRPTLNVYGNSGYPHQTGIGVYSYPRDLEAVKARMREVDRDRNQIELELESQGYSLAPSAVLVPVFAHRFVVCGSDPRQSTVLSIEGLDAIVYADSLPAYLEQEFLHG